MIKSLLLTTLLINTTPSVNLNIQKRANENETTQQYNTQLTTEYNNINQIYTDIIRDENYYNQINSITKGSNTLTNFSNTTNSYNITKIENDNTIVNKVFFIDQQNYYLGTIHGTHNLKYEIDITTLYKTQNLNHFEIYKPDYFDITITPAIITRSDQSTYINNILWTSYTLNDIETIKENFSNIEDKTTKTIEYNYTNSTGILNITTDIDIYNYGTYYIAFFIDIESNLTTSNRYAILENTSINLTQATGTIYINTNTINYEVVDIGGLMLQILTMPFSFITQAFNLTLFANTPYQINIGAFIKGLIAILTIMFIIKTFTSGFTVLGNFTKDNSKPEKKKKDD